MTYPEVSHQGASDMFGFPFREMSYILHHYIQSTILTAQVYLENQRKQSTQLAGAGLNIIETKLTAKLTYYIQEISRPQRNFFCFKKKQIKYLIL